MLNDSIKQKNDSVLRNCRVEEGGLHVSSSHGVYLKEYFEHYYSESETQQMIESAVAEHTQIARDVLQEYYDNEQQLLEKIEELKANKLENLYSELDHDENKFMRIELETVKKDRDKALAELSELKTKLPQPVEINEELSDAITKAKNIYGSDWERIFFIGDESIPFNVQIAIRKLTYWETISIIKNGYTVKPKQTLDAGLEKRISSILGMYMKYHKKYTLKVITQMLEEEGIE